MIRNNLLKLAFSYNWQTVLVIRVCKFTFYFDGANFVGFSGHGILNWVVISVEIEESCLPLGRLLVVFRRFVEKPDNQSLLCVESVVGLLNDCALGTVDNL